MVGTITVLITDDHEKIRRSIRTLLEQNLDMRVVGEAKNGLEAIRLLAELNPDILILDIQMPEMDGIGVLDWIQKTRCRVTTVILSNINDRIVRQEAARYGVSEYLLKEQGPTLLVGAVRNAAQRL